MPSSAASAEICSSLREKLKLSSVMARLEVLGHLVAVYDPAHPQGDLVLAPQGLVLALDGGADLAQVGLGGGQQLGALAGPLGGQGGVAAGDQAFAGVVGVGYLGEVDLVEQAHLQRPRSGQGGDGGRPQAGEPAQPADGSAAPRCGPR